VAAVVDQAAGATVERRARAGANRQRELTALSFSVVSRRNQVRFTRPDQQWERDARGQGQRLLSARKSALAARVLQSSARIVVIALAFGFIVMEVGVG
jgi:hypothetical protein